MTNPISRVSALNPRTICILFWAAALVLLPFSGFCEPPAGTSPDGLSFPQSHWRIGVGAGILAQAEETPFEYQSVPCDLFFDYDLDRWLKFRIGYARSETTYEYQQYISDGSTSGIDTVHNRLKTDVMYLAYRYARPLTGRITGFVLAGPAFLRSKMNTSHDLASDTTKDSGNGIVASAGARYRVNRYGLGVQLHLLRREGGFAGANIRTGSNQLQLFAYYDF